MEKQRVCVAGGAGFLGSHLVDYFLSKDYQVVCVDNLITGSLDNLEQHKNNQDFEFIEHDLSQPIEITGNLDYVLNFASAASPVDYTNHPIKTLKVGSLGTHNTLGLAKAKGARYLFASTSEIYGDPLVHPQTEEYWGNVNPIGPRSMYDEAKRFSEALVMAYHRSHGLDTKLVRIFNTYGPRMQIEDGRVVPNFINQALKEKDLTVYGDGSQTRSFCYVEDEVEGIYRLLKSDRNNPINIGNPQEMSILDFAKKIILITGSKSDIIFKDLPVNDPKLRCPDISKAKEYLGWEPKISFDEGMKRTIKWFQDRG